MKHKRKYRLRAKAADPALHTLLLMHYRLGSTAKAVNDNLARTSALIDATIQPPT